MAEGSDLGVLFFHNAGFSTACGHGTIALATYALERGAAHAVEPETNASCRRALGNARDGHARSEEGVVEAVRFRNVPSFVHREGTARHEPGALTRRRRLRRGVLRERAAEDAASLPGSCLS